MRSGVVRRVGIAAAIVASAMLCLVRGQAFAQTASMTPALRALAAAADKEGTVIFQGSTSSWGGPDGVTEIGKRINKAYGTHISAKWVPGTSFPEDGNA